MITATIYPVKINYNQSLKEALEDANYDLLDRAITEEHFPTNQSGIRNVNIELIHFSKYNMLTSEVLDEMDKQNLRPANLRELMALSKSFPDLQKEFAIIALGSDWERSFAEWFCPVLLRHDSLRQLSTVWITKWYAGDHFATVRK